MVFKINLKIFVICLYFIKLIKSFNHTIGKNFTKLKMKHKENINNKILRNLENDEDNNNDDIDNYISIYFNKDCTYPYGFENDYREGIDYIFTEGQQFSSKHIFNIHKGEKVEIHFELEVNNLGSFFDDDNDENMKYITYVDFTHFNSNLVTNMNCLFYNCKSLISIDLSNFDTSQVTEMYHIFYGCNSLESIDLSKFNTSLVKDIRFMFFGCKSLESIDLSNFDTSQVTYMSWMFAECSSLKYIDISKFKTAKVVNMYRMFYECSSLESIKLSNFDTSQVTDMHEMFYGCSSLISINLSTFNTLKVTDMNNMFYGCSSLLSIDLSNFDMINCNSYYDMFSINNNIIYINLYNFKNDKIISKIFNNTNHEVFVCQKNRIFNNLKVYNCCNSDLQPYECNISSYQEIIPIKTDELITEKITNFLNSDISIKEDIILPEKNITNNNIDSSSKKFNKHIIIGIVVGVVVIIITITLIIFFLKKKTPNNSVNKEKKENIKKEVIYSENADISFNNKDTLPIHEYEPENDKENPIIIIFNSPVIGDTKILIDYNKTIDELIKFYFKIIKRPDLYGNQNIIFLINGESILPPYPNTSIEALISNIQNYRTIRIVVNDFEDQLINRI